MHNESFLFTRVKGDPVLLFHFMHGKDISNGSFIKPYSFPETRDCGFFLSGKNSTIGI